MSEQQSQSTRETPIPKEQPEDPLAAERILKKYLDLRAKARKLRAEAERCEREAEEIQRDFPIVGNVVGALNKVGKKRKAPAEEEEKATSSKKKGKTPVVEKRKATILPGKTMSEEEIAREGGEVPQSSFYQKGRLESMEED